MNFARRDTCISIIKRNIKKELTERGKSVGWLCRELNVNRNYISQLSDNTPLCKIVRIANTIGCNASSLLCGVGDLDWYTLLFWIRFWGIPFELVLFCFVFENGTMLRQCCISPSRLVPEKSDLILKMVLTRCWGGYVFGGRFWAVLLSVAINISNLTLFHSFVFHLQQS